jgi:hypothetical protein
MSKRKPVSSNVAVDVITSSRRRCCICFALRADDSEKRGQIAHLDRDPANSGFDNLAFLCLEHHDDYDSRPSQSKGMTVDEVKRYRTELLAHVARAIPPSDDDIIEVLTSALDRPAYRTPFHLESSLPRFREAIAETIETLNTGLTPQGFQLPSKFQIRDPMLRARVDQVVTALVQLRATFDQLVRSGAIKHCGCGQSDCPVFMLSEQAAAEMDRKRNELLVLASTLNPNLPRGFYDIE